MISVVITEVMQFTILTLTSLAIGMHRHLQSLAGMIQMPFPPAGPTRSSAGSSGWIGRASSTK